MPARSRCLIWLELHFSYNPWLSGHDFQLKLYLLLRQALFERIALIQVFIGAIPVSGSA